MADTSAGLGGLRIKRQELLDALRRERRADMTLHEVARRLALSSFEIRQVIAANLLPTERRRPNGLRNAAEFVSFDDLERFLASYQTNKTAAAHLNLSWGEMHRRVNVAGLVPDAIGNGARIYKRDAILKL
ncbi:hypothetical protein NHU_00930 [Rhodovulum sulfidophilum]|uniref:Helix-turn-helix domain-containing protein n=1 Tax=Rhodovulum sulfidophilum TaxID=35806 RepID=A0A0D6AZ02_RHOSU|nr:hypothetical protein NHU_00930 [Rhodovulum sulfidophilum]